MDTTNGRSMGLWAANENIASLEEQLKSPLDKATRELMHEELAFAGMFMTQILKRNVRVEADLIDQLFNSSERRLSRLLLLIANYGSAGKRNPIIAKISQDDIGRDDQNHPLAIAALPCPYLAPAAECSDSDDGLYQMSIFFLESFSLRELKFPRGICLAGEVRL